MVKRGHVDVNHLLRLALCQRNFVVGDLDGNVEMILKDLRRARDVGVDLALFPEMAITGYPPEDLLLKPHFVERAEAAVQALAQETREVVAIVGFPELELDLYNAAAVLAAGRIAGVYRKAYLPNYGVFDEQRYFARGDGALVLDLDGIRVGVTICEDLWYPDGPAQWAAVEGGAGLVVSPAASPYARGKGEERERLFSVRSMDYSCYVVFCNLIGGQDEIVFDGRSVVTDPLGRVVARGRPFEDDFIVVDLDVQGVTRRRLHDPRWRQRLADPAGTVSVIPVPRSGREKPPLPQRTAIEPLSPEAELYQALVLGTRDYARKNGFEHAVLGLSGGIDSALVLAVATDALGAAAVTAVSMPSRYTSVESRRDAAALARGLGAELITMAIDGPIDALLGALEEPFQGVEADEAEENIQARIRGLLLMALSNKFGWLVLTTGNKSEMSTGYATLYGDMAGGFSILKDVPKTWVYRLARWRNREGEVIPDRILEKPPSAELREGQRDTDSLPPYEILDPILAAYVEEDRSPEEIAELGFDPGVVGRVVKMVDGAEYKRRQAPPGIRTSGRAFGKDRRLPITNRYGEGRSSG